MTLKKVFEREMGLADNTLHEFILNAFKEGCVPQSKEDFESCFNYNTTDDSLCFENRFGEDRQDVAMMFFNPFFCAVPQVYRKNLRNQEYCNFELLDLEYQFQLARFSCDLSYLKDLREEVYIRHGNNLAFIQYDVYKNSHFPAEDAEFEENSGQNIEEMKKSISNYRTKFKKILKFMDQKILAISSVGQEFSEDLNQAVEDEYPEIEAE